MRKYFNSLIDSDFLKGFIAMKSGFDIESKDKKLDIWRDLLNFYRQSTNVHLLLLNISFDRLAYEFESVLVKEFLELYLQGSEEITIDQSIAHQEVQSNLLLKYDFVFRKEEMPYSRICKNCGIPFVSVVNLFYKWKHFSKTQTKVISSKVTGRIAKKGWDSLNIPKPECNAIILCDNYIFSKESHILNNLIPLLRVILPKKLEIEFDLTLFSSQYYNTRIIEDGRNAYVTEKELTDIYNKVNIYLIKEFADIKINLTIVFKFLSDYHDRVIFTNNFFFKSGNSFTYFGDDCTPILPSPTTLDIHPLPATNDNMTYFETYLILLERFQRLLLKSKVKVGSGKNRLFEKLISI